jgi:pimeloyl-ACP methyl ester carboxylesterase
MRAIQRKVFSGLVFLLLLTVCGMAAAQTPRSAPPPEEATVTTADGVQLKLTYYPSAYGKGTAQAKQVTPVVLLHDYKSSRAVYAPLAERLQAPAEGEPDRPSFAAVTVDLRGHGGSNRVTLPDGSMADLDAARFGKNDLLAMATLDMESVRSFLVGKNDAGELNLNKLCLIGSGMGAAVAANWALQDWSAPPLAVGKQGQDVKGIVLISPRWSTNGLSFQAPMRFRPLKQNVAWLLMYGDKDPKVRADVSRIMKQLERFHPDANQAGVQKYSSLMVVKLPSKLQGDTLITQAGQPAEQQIITFLVENIAKKNQPWIARRSRLP